MGGRIVTLRDEDDGVDRRSLWAYVDRDGTLHIDGQDLGPGTAIVSWDGEYEWFQTIAAGHVPRVVALLGGRAGEDVLDVLARYADGGRADEVERLLRESDIPIDRHVV